MTRFNIDFYASKETTISEAYIPESSEKATDCHFSNQLALSFEFTQGFGSKENFSLSNGNAKRCLLLSKLLYYNFKIVNNLFSFLSYS